MTLEIVKEWSQRLGSFGIEVELKEAKTFIKARLSRYFLRADLGFSSDKMEFCDEFFDHPPDYPHLQAKVFFRKRCPSDGIETKFVKLFSTDLSNLTHLSTEIEKSQDEFEALQLIKFLTVRFTRQESCVEHVHLDTVSSPVHYEVVSVRQEVTDLNFEDAVTSLAKKIQEICFSFPFDHFLFKDIPFYPIFSKFMFALQLTAYDLFRSSCKQHAKFVSYLEHHLLSQWNDIDCDERMAMYPEVGKAIKAYVWQVDHAAHLAGLLRTSGHCHSLSEEVVQMEIKTDMDHFLEDPDQEFSNYLEEY